MQVLVEIYTLQLVLGIIVLMKESTRMSNNVIHLRLVKGTIQAFNTKTCQVLSQDTKRILKLRFPHQPDDKSQLVKFHSMDL